MQIKTSTKKPYRNNCVITRPPPSNSFQKFQTGLVVWVWVGRFQGKTWWAVLPCKSRKPRENLRSEKKFQTGIPHLSLRGGSGNYTITVKLIIAKIWKNLGNHTLKSCHFFLVRSWSPNVLFTFVVLIPKRF